MNQSMTITVGREDGCDVVLPYKSVSRRHIEVGHASQPGYYVVRDLGSSYGTYVDAARISTATVHEKDVLQLGGEVIAVSRLVYPLAQKSMVRSLDTVLSIGRAPENDVIIDVPTVSGRHCQLEHLQGHIAVRDLGSSNGTFVNGFPVVGADTRFVTVDHKLSLGSYQLPADQLRRLLAQMYVPKASPAAERSGSVPFSAGPPDDPSAAKRHLAVAPDLSSGVCLDLIDLHRRVTLSSGQEKTILNGVSASIYPGEMVALMGPSGAGKTTLLEVLTGQTTPSKGHVLFSGKQLGANRDLLRQLVGFVPQEDVMHRDLTVRDVLRYTARLRLPPNVGAPEIDRRIGQVLTQMGIADVADTIVGGEHVRGVSGGQRKRVNIAMELLTRPPVLFLDEPTSGLDSTSTLQVLRVLRSLADSGTTIIMTIHQPRKEAYDLLDMLLLLAKGGHLAYFGPAETSADYLAKQSSLVSKKATNPADYVIDVLDPVDSQHRRSPEAWATEFRSSELYRNVVSERQRNTRSGTKESKTPLTPPVRPDVFTQLGVLLSRYHQRKCANVRFLMTSIAWPILLGVLFGVICKTAPELDFIPIPELLPREFKVNPDGPIAGTERIAIFLVVIACFFFACANVARELVAERPVFLRESRAGLHAGPYLSAIFLWQAALATMQATIVTALLWGIVGLKTSALLGAVLLVSLTAMSGIAVGLVISAVSKTEVTAVSWVPLVLIPQMILAGVLKPYHALGAGKLISALIPARWGFESIQRHLYSQYQYSDASESVEQMTYVCKEFTDCSGVISVTKDADPHGVFQLLPGNPGYPDATVMECAMALGAGMLSMVLLAYLLVRRQAE